MEGEPDPLAQLVDMYLSDSPVKLEQLQKAAEAGDLAGMEAAAHSLKGSSNNLGARALGDLCLGVEEASKEGKKDTVLNLVTAIQVEYSKVRELLLTEKER